MSGAATRLLPLEDFCLTGSGGTPSRSNSSFYGGQIPWVKSGELREGVIFQTEETITEAALRNSSAKLVPEGAILLAMYGATVGRLATLGIEAATNQAICNIRPDPAIANSRYVYRALEAKVPELIAQATGGAQPNISQEKVRKINIPLPPLEEQRRIAAILDQADQLRQKRRQAISLLDSLTQSIFLEMFGDPVSNPKGLKRLDLVSVARFTSGATPSKSVPEFWEGSIPWVSPKDMKVNEIYDAEDHVSVSALERTNLKSIEPDTTLIVVRGMILVHTVPLAVTKLPVTINQDMKAIAFSSNIHPMVGFWNLKVQAAYILSQIATAAHGTKKLDMEVLEKLPILVPPSDGQSAFVAASEKVMDTIKHCMNSSRDLEHNFSSLQHRAFVGQL